MSQIYVPLQESFQRHSRVLRLRLPHGRARHPDVPLALPGRDGDGARARGLEAGGRVRGGGAGALNRQSEMDSISTLAHKRQKNLTPCKRKKRNYLWPLSSCSTTKKKCSVTFSFSHAREKKRWVENHLGLSSPAHKVPIYQRERNRERESSFRNLQM